MTLLALLAAGATVALAQSTPAGQARAEQLPGLPRDVNGFQRWLRLNARPIPPRRSDAHIGMKNVYVNRTRRQIAPRERQRFPYPYGSIVVKASTRPGQRFIWLVAIMRKIRGADPAHNDWRFVEYTRQSARGSFSEVASGAVCYGCHVQAKARDYVFTRLTSR